MSSKVADFLIKQISSVYGGRYYSYADQFLRALPICDALAQQDSPDAKKAGRLAEETSALATNRLSLSRKLLAFPESFVSDLPHQVEFDTIKRILHKQPSAEGLKISTEQITVEQALYGFEVHFGTQSPFEFETREHAECVAEALRCHDRQSLSKKEVLSWQLPVSIAGCQQLLKLLTKARSEIEKTQGKISSNEDEVNGLIFSMYGVKKQEKNVIESFLARYSSGFHGADTEEVDEEAED